MNWARRTIGRITGCKQAMLPALGLAMLLPVYAAAQPPVGRNDQAMQGEIESFTTAPRGEVDGAVFTDGKTIHWPPHVGGRMADIIKIGDRVEVVGQQETGPAGDSHFEVRTLKNTGSGASVEVATIGPPRPPRDRGPRNEENALAVKQAQFEGRLRGLRQRRAARWMEPFWITVCTSTGLRMWAIVSQGFSTKAIALKPQAAGNKDPRATNDWRRNLSRMPARTRRSTSVILIRRRHAAVARAAGQIAFAASCRPFAEGWSDLPRRRVVKSMAPYSPGAP